MFVRERVISFPWSGRDNFNKAKCPVFPVFLTNLKMILSLANRRLLNSACSGGPAVAACLNGLCGQGYFCSNNNFCCRCQTGNTTGPCVNGICPTGYTCGAGNLCYVTQGGK
ncbi:hypothetical protein WR25_06409 [Diploscapter pachys]|uniref:CC domain-containing protein n=1 Tax=Diploscapter pachys TaxID=2018661 RepID=A0A2A2LZL2_9BILA|nr:hypothetical protein WR25_06409 [Diploscapter pachys]